MARNPLSSRLIVELLETRDTPSTFDLGVAGDFNVFVTGNFQSQYSDTEGRLAAGGDVSLTGYGLGDKLTNSNGSRDDLIVGGNLDFSNGQVFYGNVAVAGTANLASFGLPNGTVKTTTGLDFTAAGTDLAARSAAYGAQLANGTVTSNFDSLKLVGTDTNQNVFTLWAGQLAKATGLEIDVPQGSQVLINVRGNVITMQNFAIWLNGATPDNVLFNFYQARELHFSAIGIPASVLAPDADVFFDNGQMSGTLVARSFTGTGQFNFVPPTTHDCGCVGTLSGQVTVEQPDGSVVPLNGVTINLTGVTAVGTQDITRVATTDANGNYTFNLPVGRYTITAVTPTGLTFVAATVGTNSGSDQLGTVQGQSIVDLLLYKGNNAVGYDFEFSLPPMAA